MFISSAVCSICTHRMSRDLWLVSSQATTLLNTTPSERYLKYVVYSSDSDYPKKLLHITDTCMYIQYAYITDTCMYIIYTEHTVCVHNRYMHVHTVCVHNRYSMYVQHFGFNKFGVLFSYRRLQSTYETTVLSTQCFSKS